MNTPNFKKLLSIQLDSTANIVQLLQLPDKLIPLFISLCYLKVLSKNHSKFLIAIVTLGCVDIMHS